MKRILKAALLVLILHGSAFATFTFVDSDASGSLSGASTTIASPGVTVNLGDLVWVICGHEGTVSATYAVDDGAGHNLTADPDGVHDNPGSNGEPHFIMFYTLSAQTSGTNSVVFTCTFAAGKTFRNEHVWVWTPSAPCSFEDSAGAGGTTAGADEVDSSGNITTVGTDGIALAVYAEFGSVINAGTEKINGNVADRTQNAASGNYRTWSKTYAAGLTGSAQATVHNSGARWDLGVMAFKVGTGASAVRHDLQMMGVGR